MSAAPIFISQVKREFRHPYTASTKARIIDEAQELVRTTFLLIDHSFRPNAEPGTISFEIEEGARDCIVRVRGIPRLVQHAVTVFGSVAGWTGERRRVTVLATTGISHRSNAAATAAAAPAAAAMGNRPGRFKKTRVTHRAPVKPRLTKIAEELEKPVHEVKPILQRYNAYYASLQDRGFMPRDARVLADHAFRSELRGVFVPPKH